MPQQINFDVYRQKVAIRMGRLEEQLLILEIAKEEAESNFSEVSRKYNELLAQVETKNSEDQPEADPDKV